MRVVTIIIAVIGAMRRSSDKNLLRASQPASDPKKQRANEKLQKSCTKSIAAFDRWTQYLQPVADGIDPVREKKVRNGVIAVAVLLIFAIGLSQIDRTSGNNAESSAPPNPASQPNPTPQSSLAGTEYTLSTLSAKTPLSPFARIELDGLGCTALNLPADIKGACEDIFAHAIKKGFDEDAIPNPNDPLDNRRKTGLELLASKNNGFAMWQLAAGSDQRACSNKDDAAKVVELYTVAAQSGVPNAGFRLAQLYHTGSCYLGITSDHNMPDDDNAQKFFDLAFDTALRLATDKNDIISERDLVYIYRTGSAEYGSTRIVPNKVEAQKWTDQLLHTEYSGRKEAVWEDGLYVTCSTDSSIGSRLNQILLEMENASAHEISATRNSSYTLQGMSNPSLSSDATAELARERDSYEQEIASSHKQLGESTQSFVKLWEEQSDDYRQQFESQTWEQPYGILLLNPHGITVKSGLTGQITPVSERCIQVYIDNIRGKVLQIDTCPIGLSFREPRRVLYDIAKQKE